MSKEACALLLTYQSLDKIKFRCWHTTQPRKELRVSFDPRLDGRFIILCCKAGSSPGRPSEKDRVDIGSSWTEFSSTSASSLWIVISLPRYINASSSLELRAPESIGAFDAVRRYLYVIRLLRLALVI